MRTILKLIQEGKNLLDKLQKQHKLKITFEESKRYATYSELIELKRTMYNMPDDVDSECITILRDKYKYLNLSYIDEAINEASTQLIKRAI